MESDSTISRSRRQDPPLPDTDLARAAGSNFLPDISLEPGRTGYVEGLVRLQAQAPADDLFLYLGGAAEDRLDAAEPPELTIVPENKRSCSRRSRPGFIWSARVTAFSRSNLGGDHAPGDCLAARQLPEPRRGADDHAEPAAADIPAINTDVDWLRRLELAPP